jgi:hypothetical protein
MDAVALGRPALIQAYPWTSCLAIASSICVLPQITVLLLSCSHVLDSGRDSIALPEA